MLKPGDRLGLEEVTAQGAGMGAFGVNQTWPQDAVMSPNGPNAKCQDVRYGAATKSALKTLQKKSSACTKRIGDREQYQLPLHLQ